MRVVVEGGSDEWAARRIVETAGHAVEKLYVKRGKANLDAALPKYARASAHQPWVVFRDSDNECPVHLRTRLLAGVAGRPPLFALRIAHTMTEAWFLADPQGVSEYFGFSVDKIPAEPEALAHAKRTLLQLCLASRKRDIRTEVALSAIQPGALFVHHLNTFAAQYWNIDAAAENSPSLRRAIAALRDLPPGASS